MTVNSEHKFQPGRSGNPAGRPRGSKSKSTQLIERLVTGNIAEVKQIIDVVVAKAKEGEAWAVTELLKRLWVVPRSRLVSVAAAEVGRRRECRDSRGHARSSGWLIDD